MNVDKAPKKEVVQYIQGQPSPGPGYFLVDKATGKALTRAVTKRAVEDGKYKMPDGSDVSSTDAIVWEKGIDIGATKRTGTRRVREKRAPKSKKAPKTKAKNIFASSKRYGSNIGSALTRVLKKRKNKLTTCSNCSRRKRAEAYKCYTNREAEWESAQAEEAEHLAEEAEYEAVQAELDAEFQREEAERLKKAATILRQAEYNPQKSKKKMYIASAPNSPRRVNNSNSNLGDLARRLKSVKISNNDSLSKMMRGMAV